ncbi:MAG: aldehyde dehydrogenase family protein [Limisphaerales bacterium]
MRAQLTKNVAEFLRTPVQHFIGGQFKPGATGATAQALNPSDGSPLATVAMGGATEIDEAVAAAWKAFPAWSALSPSERAVKLHRFAEHLEKHSADLALLESLDVGKAISAAEGFDVPFGIECLRYFADLSTRAHYEIPLAIKNIEARTHRAPHGVCGFIFPWNFPFTLLLWGIAPALAAGNTVVVKPSEVAPLSSLFVAKLAAEAGLPRRRDQSRHRRRPFSGRGAGGSSKNQTHVVHRFAGSRQKNRRNLRTQSCAVQTGTRR